MEQEAKGIRYQSGHYSTVQGIMYYINEQTLMAEHHKQQKKKAAGIDGVTKKSCDKNAEEAIQD